MRSIVTLAILLGTTVPALAEPTTLQLDAMLGDASTATSPMSTTFTGGTSVRTGLGARRGAFAAMVRVAFTPIHATEITPAMHLTDVATSADVEWFVHQGRLEPFVALGAHTDGAIGYQDDSGGGDAVGRASGVELGLGVQLTSRGDAHTAAARLEVVYDQHGMLFVGIGGSLGALISRD